MPSTNYFFKVKINLNKGLAQINYKQIIKKHQYYKKTKNNGKIFQDYVKSKSFKTHHTSGSFWQFTNAVALSPFFITIIQHLFSININ